MDALAKAEHAHMLCREAAILAQRGMFTEAEENATRGITELKESVLQVPRMMQLGRISETWNEEVAMTA